MKRGPTLSDYFEAISRHMDGKTLIVRSGQAAELARLVRKEFSVSRKLVLTSRYGIMDPGRWLHLVHARHPELFRSA